MTGRVAVLGALHLDVVVDAPHLPRPGETLMGSRVAYRLGGKGANQAVAAARMGVPAAMIGRVGNDAFADDILAALDSAGVDRRAVTRSAGASGMSAAIVEAGGEYAAVVISGVNAGLSAADAALPEDTRVLLLQNEVPEAANLAAAGAARDLGAEVILNAAPARPLPDALAAMTDILVVNRVEAQDLTGEAAPEAAARALAVRVGEVIVTLGAEGALHAAGGHATLHAPHDVCAVSSHGAGDSFLGALAAVRAGGMPVAAALAFAQAAAALFVETAPEARGDIDRTRIASRFEC